VGERLLLVGMMGSGKSTVARLAADRLGWAWIDTDEMVVRATGSSVADLFSHHGEARFREEEAAAIASALEGDEAMVVSVGGGAVLDPANRDRLKAGGTVVWLRARPETLVERVGDGAGRPLLAGDSRQAREETLRTLERARRSLYAEVATEIVDVDGLDAGTVADRLVDAVGFDAPGREARR